MSSVPDEGKKYDQGKERYDLIPPLGLHEFVKVLTFGAAKYGARNWNLVDEHKDRYFAAMNRHIWAWWRGETNDPESGLHHLAHAMCCLSFLLEKELEENIKDSLGKEALGDALGFIPSKWFPPKHPVTSKD